MYHSVVPVRNPGADEESQALPLPRSLLLSLPVGEGPLQAASALVLDEAHVAVVGVPHPSAGAGKGECGLITLPQNECHKCSAQTKLFEIFRCN